MVPPDQPLIRDFCNPDHNIRKISDMKEIMNAEKGTTSTREERNKALANHDRVAKPIEMVIAPLFFTDHSRFMDGPTMFLFEYQPGIHLDLAFVALTVADLQNIAILAE